MVDLKFTQLDAKLETAMPPFFCIEAGFAWLNTNHPEHGPCSFYATSDYGFTLPYTVDGVWFGHAHKWLAE